MKYVWSFEHQSWWRPGEMGYTRDLIEAGLYTDVWAARIVHHANRYLKEGERNEIAVDAEALNEQICFWMGFREKLARLLSLLDTTLEMTGEIGAIIEPEKTARTSEIREYVKTLRRRLDAVLDESPRV